MEGHRAAEVGADPAVHRRKREAGDAHRVHRGALGEDRRALGLREHVEQLRARDVVDVEVDTVLVEERERALDELVRDGRLLDDDRSVGFSFGLAEEVDALRRSGRVGEPEARAVEQAASDALTAGCRTADLGGSLSTRAMADEVIRRIEA
jgi:hypothetical protein